EESGEAFAPVFHMRCAAPRLPRECIPNKSGKPRYQEHRHECRDTSDSESRNSPFRFLQHENYEHELNRADDYRHPCDAEQQTNPDYRVFDFHRSRDPFLPEYPRSRYWKQNEKGHCESLARQVHRATPLHLHASNPRPVIHRQAEVVADSECRHDEKILEVRSGAKQHQHVGSYEDSLDDCDRTGQDEDDVQSPQRVGIIDNLRTCSPYEI